MRPRVRDDSSSPPQSPLTLPPEAQPQPDSTTPSMTARRTIGGGGASGLSSMVVRPSENSGFEENGVDNGDAHAAGGLDKPRSPFRRRTSHSPVFRRRPSPPRFRRRESPSEFRRRDAPPGFHHPRGFKDDADSLSPPPHRSRQDDGRHDPDYHYPPRPSFGRGILGGRGSGRFRDVSPHYGPSRGRGSGKGHHTVPRRLSPVEGDYVHRNDPNLSPREGDWICQNPSCGNLNFARRTHCNNCNEHRFGPDGREFSRSPRRDYLNSPSQFQSPPRISGLSRMNRPLRREISFRSPRGWTMDDPRDFRYGSPDLRRGGRLPDDYGREKPDYDDEHDHIDKHKFDWSRRGEWDPRSERDDFISTRRGMGHRSPSPPARWFRYERERSRSRSPVAGERSFTYAGRYEGDRPKRYSGSFTGRGHPDISNTGRGRGRSYRHNNDIIGRPGEHRRNSRDLY